METALKTADKLEKLVTDYKNYQRIEEEAKEQKELLAAEIKAALGDYGVYHAGPYKITWNTVTTARVDSKRLKLEYPKIAELVSCSSTSDRLTVN